jgi:hypothetical protein
LLKDRAFHPDPCVAKLLTGGFTQVKVIRRVKGEGRGHGGKILVEVAG